MAAVSGSFHLSRPCQLIALGFGAGLSPRAPGTVGTALAVPLYLALAQLPWEWYVLAAVAGFVLGVHCCGRTARDVGVHDHPAIVWDEVIGYLITMTAAPPEWWWPLMGFILFRLFDILKPPPIRGLDRRVHGGLGIMLDDVAAGLFAWACIQVLAWL